MRALQHEQFQTPDQPHTEMSVSQFFEQWLDALKSSYRPSSWESYRSNLHHHILPAIGGIGIADLTSFELNRLYASLLSSGRLTGGGLSHRTARYVHAVIHRGLRDAVRWGYVQKNVADLADPPRYPAARFSTWSKDQLSRFLVSVRSDKHYAAWVLLATTGMRRGEVLGLRPQDIDFATEVVRIRQAVISVRRQVLISDPKTRKAARQIPLAPQASAALREKISEVSPSSEGDGFVFNLKGKPIHPDRFSARFQLLSRRAGLPRIRLHDLRHTFATLALGEGIHPKVVSEILGHANIAITLEIYSHTLPSLQREATAKVAELLFQGPQDDGPDNRPTDADPAFL